MPLLTRDAPRLLLTVKNKPHASQMDHFDVMPALPASNPAIPPVKKGPTQEEINAEPMSSDDEKGVAFRHLPRHPADSPTQAASIFRCPSSRLVYGGREASPSFQPAPELGATAITDTKYKRSEPSSSDSDDFIFASQEHKRPRISYSGNIHALRPQERSAVRRQKPRQCAAKGTFRKPRSSSAHQDAPRATFKHIAMPSVAANIEQARTAFHKPGQISTELDEATDQDDLSEPPGDIEGRDIADLDLSSVEPHVSMTECTICNEQVELSLRQGFEDEFNQGKQLNYRWQERFCRYHQRRKAEQVWAAKGYPEIDWRALMKRLASKRHIQHLKRVITGDQPSQYSERLEQRLKRGSKEAAEAWVDDEEGRKSAGAGYYGPQGEKLMINFIASRFAGLLRERARKYKLLAASGFAGGISSFVQAVLVPELAVSLISEDLGCNERQAVEVIAESADLGELLHPEQQEHIVGDGMDEDEVAAETQ